jgi:hypothetical protein
MTTSPVPRHLDLITHDELIVSVRSLLYTGIVYRLQGLEGTELTGKALPEVALKPWLETSLITVLDYAQRGDGAEEAGANVAQLENSLKGLLPELGRPWLLKNKDPQTSLECIMRGAHARLSLKLGMSPGIPIGWVACLASIPVGTMRVYVGRDRLRDKAMKQGYLNPKVAMAWLESRGIEGPPITEKVPSPMVSFSIPNLKDKEAGYVAMKKAHEQLMSQEGSIFEELKEIKEVVDVAQGADAELVKKLLEHPNPVFEMKKVAKGEAKADIKEDESSVPWGNPAKIYHTQEAIDHVAMQQLHAAAYKISAFGKVPGIALPLTEEVSQLVLSLPDEKLGTWAQEHSKDANHIWKCLDNVTDKTKYKEARDKLGAVLCWNEIQKLDSQGKVAEGFNSTAIGGTSLEEVMKSPKFELPPGTDPEIANALDVLEDCVLKDCVSASIAAQAVLLVPEEILTDWYSTLGPNEKAALAKTLDKAKGPKGTKARVKLGKKELAKKIDKLTKVGKIKNALNILGSDDILYESTMIADAVLALPGPVLKQWVVEHIDKTKGFITLLNKANGTKAATAMKHLVISVGAAKQTQDKIHSVEPDSAEGAAFGVLSGYAPGLFSPADVVNAVLVLPPSILLDWLAQPSQARSHVLAVLDDTKGPEAATARHKIAGGCGTSWGHIMKAYVENTHPTIQLQEATQPLTPAEITEKVMQAAGHVLDMEDSELLDWITKNPTAAAKVLEKLKGVPTALTGKAVNKVEKLVASLKSNLLTKKANAAIFKELKETAKKATPAKDAKALAKKIDKLMKESTIGDALLGMEISDSSMLGEATMLIPAGTPMMPIHGEKQIEYKVLKSKEPKAKVEELMKLVDSGAISFEKAKELAASSKEPVITGIQEPSLTFQHNAALASQCPVADDWKSKPLSSYSDEHQDEYDPGEPLPHLVKKHDPELKAAWKKAAEVALLQKLDEPGKSHG